MSKIAMSNFARRHTAQSPFSHFDGTFDELCELVACYLDAGVEIAPGILKVTISGGSRFFSSLISVTKDTPLVGYFEPRSKGEHPVLTIRAQDGKKVQAKETDIILYSKDLLDSDPSEQGHTSPWLIVSINAKVFHGEEPMNPISMARNYLGLPGGTLTNYSAEQFARAIVYWFGGDGFAPYVMLDTNVKT